MVGGGTPWSSHVRMASSPSVTDTLSGCVGPPAPSALGRGRTGDTRTAASEANRLASWMVDDRSTAFCVAGLTINRELDPPGGVASRVARRAGELSALAPRRRADEEAAIGIQEEVRTAQAQQLSLLRKHIQTGACFSFGQNFIDTKNLIRFHKIVTLFALIIIYCH